MQYTRNQVAEILARTLSEGRPVIAAGAGTGISAKFAEKGGSDLIVIYNSGRYRMTGYSSWAGLLPIGDANGIVLEMGEHEVLPIVKKAPVIAGVFPSDPTREMWHFLKQVKDLGFSGVINFPTVALLEGEFRSGMETSGLGFDRDVDMIEQAHGMNLYTMAYVFNVEEAVKMAEAGVDLNVAHMGNTAGGSVGQDGVPVLDDAARRTQEIADAGRRANPKIITLCHGGPIAMPDDVAYILEQTDVEGFVGASSMERLPVEKPLEETTRKFKSLSIRKRS